MKGRITLLLIVVALLVGAGVGYFANNKFSGTAAKTDSCAPLSSLGDAPIPIGFEPTVSYQGEWGVSIATFAAKADNASALNYVCTYTGSGTITFYVGLANYLGGWNTMVVLAHKLGSSSNGTLSVQASVGNETSTASTTQSYGSATATASFYFAN